MAKARAVLARVELLPRGTLLTATMSANDPTVTVVRLSFPIATDSPAEALYQTLLATRHIASGWLVGVPQAYDGGRIEITGTATDRGAPLEALVLATFEIRNFDNSSDVAAADTEA